MKPVCNVVGDSTVEIVLPRCSLEPSKSGKSLIVASTRGPVQTEAVINGKPVVIVATAYIKNDRGNVT